MRLGLLAIELGAGRKKVDDVIDPAAGILLRKKTGEKVEAGEVLATIFSERRTALDRVKGEMAAAIPVADRVPPVAPLIRSRIDASGVHAWTTPVQY
jgi:pyrimidine-nucleoside phosphorylase